MVLDAIKNRSSARVPYDPTRRPSVEDIRLILEAARWAPTAHNMQNFEIVVVDDPSILDAFGGIESQVSETFLRENYEQMSFFEEELLSKKVGVLASMFPPSWRSLADITSGQAAADGQRNMGSWLQHAPDVLVVIYDSRLRAPASEGDVLGKISLGCVLENMWLMAETLGICCQVMSAFSGEQVEPQVRRLIGFPEHMRIAFVCRLGYAVPRPSQLRVRREVADFTHHNRFGRKGLKGLRSGRKVSGGMAETKKAKGTLTIYDVANRAGVSIASVSRVLNGQGSPRAETRERVMRAVRELSFVPDGAVRALSNGLKKVVGGRLPARR